MSTDYWGKTTSQRLMPAPLLDLADVLARRAAGLSGRLAPEIADCLRKLFMDRGAEYVRNLEGLPQIEFGMSFIDRDVDYRHRIAEALRQHCRSLLTAASPGFVVPAAMTTEQKLTELGLKPDLWLVDKATNQAFAKLNQDVGTSLSSIEPLTSFDEFRVLEKMLSACIYQVDCTLEAFLPSALRERIHKAFLCDERILETKIKKESVPAVLCVFVQGSLPHGEFEMFTGLPSAEARLEVDKLENLGILAFSKLKPGSLIPCLPSWLGAYLLPHLDLR